MYTIINPQIFVQAYTGALDGMLAAKRALQSATPSDYAASAVDASTWAESVDTAWNNAATADAIAVGLVYTGSFAAWEEREASGTLTPGQCATPAAALVAAIVESEVLWTANGWTPPPWGGGGTLPALPGADGTYDLRVLGGVGSWVLVFASQNQGAYTFQPEGGSQTPILFNTQVALSAALVAGLNIPATIYLDCQFNGDSYALTADLNLAHQPTLIGVTNQLTNSPPSLNTAGFVISPLVAIENMTLVVSGAAAVTASWRSLSLADAILESGDGNLFATAQNFGTTTILARNSQIGDAGGANPVIALPAGSVTSLSLLEGSKLQRAGISVAAGATLAITAEPGSSYDPSYLTIPGVTITVPPPPGAIVFQPGGSGQANLYATEASAQGAALAVLGPEPVWFDFEFSANTYAAAGNLDFGGGADWIGRPNPASGIVPTLTTASAIRPPETIVDLAISGATAGFVFSPFPAYLRLAGRASLVAAPGTLFYNAIGADLLLLEDESTLGDGVNQVIGVNAGATLNVAVSAHFPGGGLRAGAIVPAAGGTLIVHRAAGSFVDDSYYTLPGCTVINEPLALPLSIGPGASATAPGSLAVGATATATAADAMVMGAGAIGSAASSNTFGPGAFGRYVGAIVHSSAGQAQSGICEYLANIAGNATGPMTNIGGTGLVTTAGVAYSLKCRIVAWQAGGVGTPGSWSYELLVHNSGGALTIDNQLLTSDPAFQNGNGWTFAFATAGAELVINVTGVVGQTVSAVARLDWAEVQP